MDAASLPVLLVLVHGNNGSPSDWNPAIAAFRHHSNLQAAHIHSFSSHSGSKTLVGVEELARALVKEVLAFMHGERLDTSRTRLYLLAHSLGGLVVRAALPALLESAPNLVPLGFCSIATPHMGVRRPGGGPFKWLWKTSTESACKNFYRQTGADLTFLSMETHEHALEETLLFRLIDPNGPYAQALSRFPHRTLVSSPFYDMLVPYSASAMRAWHPYSEAELEEREGDAKCCVWGYSLSFSAQHVEIIGRFARASAAGRPDETPPTNDSVVEMKDGWQADRHRFSMWPALVMDCASKMEFRRLDVQLDVTSRWQVHDGFLKKKLRNVVPDSGVAGDQFLSLLAGIVSIDVNQ